MAFGKDKFGKGLTSHIALEKRGGKDGLVATTQKLSQEITNIQFMPDEDKARICDLVVNRIEAIIKFGITKDKIDKTNIRDCSIAFSILWNRMKDISVKSKISETKTEIEETEDIGTVLDSIAAESGIISTTRVDTDKDIDTNPDKEQK